MFIIRNKRYKDLTGQKFGRLTVIKRVEDYTYIVKSTGKINRSPRWLCKCDCGNETVVLGRRLKDGTKSCGCLQIEYAQKYEDLTGQKFGKLIVIKMSHKEIQGKQSKIYWECRCDCGNIDYVNSGNLKSGVVKSCGCECGTIIHGLSKSKLYFVWLGMKSRCYNSHDDKFKYYGGRGITICNEWVTNFLNFYDWAISNGYKEGLEIDRIDNNKNYCLENCRWVNNFIQMNNTRKNVYFKIDDTIISMSELCRKYNLDYKKFRYNIRIKKENVKEYMLSKGCDVDALSIQVLSQ